MPDGEEWARRFAGYETRLAHGVRRHLRDARERLGWLAGRTAQSGPSARLANEMQRLDDLEQRLRRSLRQRFADWRSELAERRSQLWRENPAVRLREAAARLSDLRARLRTAGLGELRAARERLLPLVRTLNAVSPLATLDRGYAIVSTATGRIVRDPADAPPGTSIEARLARGRIRATVDEPSG